VDDMAEETAPPLHEIPLFATFDDGSGSEPRARPSGMAVSMSSIPTPHPSRDAFGVYPVGDLGLLRTMIPTPPVDWPQVVALRKDASALITEETQALHSRTGVAITGDDRLLLGRSIIKRVVADHVRSLHRDGAPTSGPRRRSRPTSRRSKMRCSALAACSHCSR
jgi:hypothetical protein